MRDRRRAPALALALLLTSSCADPAACPRSPKLIVGGAPVPALDVPIHTIAATDNGTCAIHDGSVWCWGDLPEAASDSAEPTPFPQLNGTTELRSFGLGFVGRRADGTSWMWGDSKSDHPLFTPEDEVGIRALDEALGTSVFADPECAVRPNRLAVHCLEHPPVLFPTPVVELTNYGDDVCVELADGSLWCGGVSHSGQLHPWRPIPQSSAPSDALLPVCVSRAHGVACLTSDAELASIDARPLDRPSTGRGAGLDEVCGLRDGHLVCVRGDGPIASVRGPPSAAVELVMGAAHACVRDADHAVWCWGENRWGQLGVPRGVPPREESLSGVPRSITASPERVCALLEGDRVECLSTATGESWTAPVPQGTRALGVADERVFARDGSGRVFVTPIAPTRARLRWEVLDIGRALDLQASAGRVCVRTRDAVHCTGGPPLGAGPPVIAVDHPQSEMLMGRSFVCVRAGPHMRCVGLGVDEIALDSEDRVFAGGHQLCVVDRRSRWRCLGNNHSGELLLEGPWAHALTPVPALTGMREAALGVGTSCFWGRAPDLLYCAGLPSWPGSSGASLRPLALPGLRAVAAGRRTCLLQGAKLVCFGDSDDPLELAPTPRRVVFRDQ